jgi:hypothetical protein
VQFGHRVRRQRQAAWTPRTLASEGPGKVPQRGGPRKETEARLPSRRQP